MSTGHKFKAEFLDIHELLLNPVLILEIIEIFHI